MAKSIKYKRIPQEVKAVQWHKHSDSRLVSENGENGITWKYTNCSLCGKSAGQHGYLNTVHGGKIICPGTWIVERPDGVQTYNNDEFKAKYEAVE